MSETGLTGSCECGWIYYELLESPLIVQACHCRACQKQSGSAFAVNLWIEGHHIRVSGKGKGPAHYPSRGGSGKPHDIFFCDRCGTTMWSRYHAAPGENYFVRAGTLDDPSVVKPDVQVHTRWKVPWLQLDNSIPAYEDFYDIKEVWPAESLDRLRANRARET
ncbi:MAG: GFA family protein [Pseudohongiellaceae bacterium]